jgi:hypothetical protein
MVYAQIYWVSGLCPSPGILNTRKHDVSEMDKAQKPGNSERYLL